MKTFILEDNEAAFIIGTIGKLPIETGAASIFQKLQQQFALITPAEPAKPTPPQE
jgi:hypothetical protein